MKAKIHVILNPASAAGRTGQKQTLILAAVDRHLGQAFSLCVTRRPLEATSSAREAVSAGSELVIAVGGDGTIQETVNGLFSRGRPINPDCQLGIINSGTGCGFLKSLDFPPDLDGQCRVIAQGWTRLIDIGRAVFSNGNGRGQERYFINECQAGIGGEVVKKVHSGSKKLGGLLAFGLNTLAVLLKYPNQRMTVTVDDGPETTGRFMGIIAANGNSMAGGMQLAPQADVGDGLLDFLFIHEQTLVERLRNFPKIYGGSHIASPKFSYFRGKSLALTSEEDISFEADGELLGHLPCRVEILPSALRVLALPAREG